VRSRRVESILVLIHELPRRGLLGNSYPDEGQALTGYLRTSLPDF
jgi:hypothetical protein